MQFCLAHVVDKTNAALAPAGHQLAHDHGPRYSIVEIAGGAEVEAAADLRDVARGLGVLAVGAGVIGWPPRPEDLDVPPRRSLATRSPRRAKPSA